MIHKGENAEIPEFCKDVSQSHSRLTRSSVMAELLRPGQLFIRKPCGGGVL